jgi:hypothetical protein
MQFEIDGSTILQWCGTLIAGLAIWALKTITNRLEIAFRKLDKVRRYLLKNTSYTEDDDDDDY